MRRRLATILTAALLGSALLPMTAMPAAGAETAVVLASEGVTSTEGPDPMGPDAEENEFAPADYEANVTWRAALYVFALVALLALYLGISYYLRVHRPSSRSSQS